MSNGLEAMLREMGMIKMLEGNKFSDLEIGDRVKFKNNSTTKAELEYVANLDFVKQEFEVLDFDPMGDPMFRPTTISVRTANENDVFKEKLVENNYIYIKPDEYIKVGEEDTTKELSYLNFEIGSIVKFRDDAEMYLGGLHIGTEEMRDFVRQDFRIVEIEGASALLDPLEIAPVEGFNFPDEVFERGSTWCPFEFIILKENISEDRYDIDKLKEGDKIKLLESSPTFKSIQRETNLDFTDVEFKIIEITTDKYGDKEPFLIPTEKKYLDEMKRANPDYFEDFDGVFFNPTHYKKVQ